MNLRENMIGILTKKTKFFLFAVLAVFAVSSVYITIETVASSAEIASLRKTREALVEERKELESSYVKSISLGDLKEKSSELGFVKPEQMMFLTKNDPVAKLP